MSNPYDCHGGPGTTEPACGACITCLHRVIDDREHAIAGLRERVERLEEAVSAADKYIAALQASDDDYTAWVCNTAEARNAYRTAKHEAKEAKP